MFEQEQKRTQEMLLRFHIEDKVGVSVIVSFVFHTVKLIILSYDVAVIQRITSCHKLCYDHTCINTLAGTSNIMTTSVTTMHFSLKESAL